MACTHGSCKLDSLLFIAMILLLIMAGRFVLGHEAMKKMSVANVLIIGLKGLGVEIGKVYNGIVNVPEDTQS